MNWTNLLIGTAVVTLFAAVTLPFAAGQTAKFKGIAYKPPFLMALYTSFFSVAAQSVAMAIVGFFVGFSGKTVSPLGVGILVVICFVINGAIVGALIKHPEKGPLGFKYGCHATQYQFGIIVLTALATYGLVAVITE